MKRSFFSAYEKRGDHLLPFHHFAVRVGLCLFLALALALVALGLGTLGYHFIANLSWIDAEFNAAMILTGMGPVAPMPDAPSKLFASGYALFSAIVFLSSVGIVISPVVHRVVHKFHIDEKERE